MNRTRTAYCAVQYLPDSGRGEAANVGVLLYVPASGRVMVRTSPTLARVKKFFSPSKDDLRRIELSVQSFEHRMARADAEREFRGEEDLAHFAAARADAVRLTAPRLMVVTDLAADFHKLYDDLVGEFSAPALDPRRRGVVPPRLAEALGRLEAAGKVWRPGRITIPTIRRGFDVVAAFQNGVTNYVRPESLTAEGKQDRLAKLGFNGRLIAEHGVGGNAARLVVVSSDPAADPKAEARYKAALTDFGVRFVPHAAADAFAAEVEATAH